MNRQTLEMVEKPGEPGIEIYGVLDNYLGINTASVYIIKINKLQTGNGR